MHIFNPRLTHALCASIVFAFAAGFAMPSTARASDVWPTKPIRIVVPVAAGSATDLVARELARRLTKGLGQTAFIDNRAGADMAIGIVTAAKSPADGYTWLLVSSTLTASPALKKVAFDPVKDFSPVSIVGYATTVAVVPPELGVHSLKEFVDRARSRPGEINYANPSIGALGHLHTALLENATGIKLTSIPYKGSAPAMTDLLANRVNFMMAPPGVALPYVQDGKLQALWVVGAERSPLYPSVPTLRELGIKDVDLEAWMGILLPVGTPLAVVTRVQAAIDAALREPGAREALERAGIRVAPGGTPAEFAQQIRADLVQWPRIFEIANVKRED